MRRTKTSRPLAFRPSNVVRHEAEARRNSSNDHFPGVGDEHAKRLGVDFDSRLAS